MFSTGWYGKPEPESVEAMVLESFVNGAGGVTFAPFNELDTPLYLYHYAKAMAALAPHESLLLEGRPEPVEGADAGYTCSAWRRDKELLLVVGHYTSRKAPTRITLPFQTVKTLANLSRAQALPAGKTLTADVPPGHAELFYATGE